MGRMGEEVDLSKKPTQRVKESKQRNISQIEEKDKTSEKKLLRDN